MSIYNDSEGKELSPDNNFEQFGIFMLPNTDNDQITRYIIESISGILTGSDNLPNSQEYQRLKTQNYQGEGLNDQRVWGVYSNFPATNFIPFEVKKAVLVVANPLTIIQNKIMEVDIVQLQQKGEYEQFLDEQCEMVNKYIDFWQGQSAQPLYVLRIEDVVSNTVDTLRELFSFLLNTDQLKETVVESKILTFNKFNKNFINFVQNYQFRIPQFLFDLQGRQAKSLLQKLEQTMFFLGYINEHAMQYLEKAQQLYNQDIQDLIQMNYQNTNMDLQFQRQNRKSVMDNLKRYTQAIQCHTMQIN